MGKKKGGSKPQQRAFKKDPVVTKVATGVKKTRTKAVVTSLKRINFQCRSQTEALDAEFTKVQQVKGLKKAEKVVAPAGKAEQSGSKKTQPQGLEVDEEPDVDMTVEQLSKLAS